MQEPRRKRTALVVRPWQQEARSEPRLWFTTHGSDDRDDAQGVPWDALSLWKRVGVIIAESVVDERDGVEAVARFADALEMHEVDGPQPEHNDHGGVSLRKDHAQASGSDAFFRN